MVSERRHRATAARIAVILALVAVAGACGRGVYHSVRPGETLYRIGKAYGVPYQQLARVNQLPDPSVIRVGQQLFIPGARRVVPVALITPRDRGVGAPLRDGLPPVSGGRLFVWPVTAGTLTSGFGPRGGGFHDGIDISVPIGTPVMAADDGEVIYSDSLPGYGNLIILRHNDGYVTVYAHNRENQVREGLRVRSGQRIATVGDSGRTTGPNLHFEVRHHNVARNPLHFLPPGFQGVERQPGTAAGGG